MKLRRQWSDVCVSKVVPSGERRVRRKVVGTEKLVVSLVGGKTKGEVEATREGSKAFDVVIT